MTKSNNKKKRSVSKDKEVVVGDNQYQRKLPEYMNSNQKRLLRSQAKGQSKQLGLDDDDENEIMRAVIE